MSTELVAEMSNMLIFYQTILAQTLCYFSLVSLVVIRKGLHFTYASIKAICE